MLLAIAGHLRVSMMSGRTCGLFPRGPFLQPSPLFYISLEPRVVKVWAIRSPLECHQVCVRPRVGTAPAPGGMPRCRGRCAPGHAHLGRTLDTPAQPVSLVFSPRGLFEGWDTGCMHNTRPLYVRPLTDAERHALEDSLRSPDAFVLRRAQILLASAAGERVGQIAPRVGFSGQAVRNVIHAFNKRGLAILTRGSHRPSVVVSAFDTPRAQALRALLHHSPRTFGKETSLWTLELAAAVAYEQGLTATRVSDETIRATLARMGVSWRRAKHWITSPDPEYARKKARRDRLIRLARQHPDWLLGFEDEVWWSRLTQPALHAWQDDERPLHLVEQTVARDDPA